ncbi:hypothetical protein DIPPA_13031 [Diplonema papillatum]|nr:hypothetical protein DIPPA_13031 [Diplonema papillatum]|eukprot:gene8602-13302_t
MGGDPAGSDPFEVRGTVSVAESSVVILARKEERGWEVLLTESEVINWLKSTREKLVPMRYGGEWKLAGGNVDEGETPDEAARRELEEEVLAETNRPVLPINAKLHPFTVKQTRPIRSRSNIIYVFVALASENPWLHDLDVTEANWGLAERRVRFKELFLSGEYEGLAPVKKESVAPEIHSLRWVPIQEAIRKCERAQVPGEWAGDFQKREYAVWNVHRQRDPMYLTGIILGELSQYQTEADVLAHVASVGSLSERLKAVQWIFPGMTQEDVDNAMKSSHFAKL